MSELRQYSENTLRDMSGPELVKLHNEAADMVSPPATHVRRFSDKQSAVRRTLRMIESAQPRKRGAPRRAYFRFPLADEVRVCRAGTLRDRIRLLLLDGATFPEVVEAVREYDHERNRHEEEHHIERRAYELVRIMHYQLGYGIDHNQETGFIQLFGDD